MEEIIQMILKDLLIVGSTLFVAWIKKRFDIQDVKTGKKTIDQL